MVVRMRHTRAHTKNRRSHHALHGARLSVAEGGAQHPRHKALLDGTPYRGRSVTKKKPTAPKAVAPKKGEKKEKPKTKKEAKKS